MEPHFWHRRWRKNEIGFHREDVNPLLERFWDQLGVAPAAPVLVPLCGKSVDLVWLKTRGHPVLGVELSPIAVAAFFAGEGLEPERLPCHSGSLWRAPGYQLFCGDFFELTAEDLGPVAVGYDRAALIAFPPDWRPRYADHLRRLLPAGTPLLVITVEYDTAEMDGPPFSVPEAEVHHLFAGDEIVRLHAEEALELSPHLRQRGLTRLQEKVYRVVAGG